MGTLLAAFVITGQDVPGRANGIVPEVEFEAKDVRSVLQDLGRRALIGITVSPQVRGPITLSLRNVSWETALQNVTRQVDATYRFERGWLYVVPREADPVSMVSANSAGPLAEIYGTLSKAVAAGRGGDLRRALATGFEARNATATKRGPDAYRALVEAFRSAKDFAVERTWRWRSSEGFEALVAYRRPDASPIYFHDSWREIDGSLRLVSREETVRDPSRRFKNALLSEVLRAVGEDAGVLLRIEPALDRRVTVDLTGATFEVFLQRLLVDADLTYRIEGGVYEIVRRE